MVFATTIEGYRQRELSRSSCNISLSDLLETDEGAVDPAEGKKIDLDVASSCLMIIMIFYN